MSTRRQLIERGLVAGVGAAGLVRPGIANVLAAAGRAPLDAGSIPQFVTPLPGLDVIAAGPERIELRMREFRAQVLPRGIPRTWVWGYLKPGQEGRSSYLGPVIVADTRDADRGEVGERPRRRAHHERPCVGERDRPDHALGGSTPRRGQRLR